MLKSLSSGTVRLITTGSPRRAGLALWFLGAFLPWAGLTYGLGIRSPNQDPFAIGRGNAFAATADDPSALYYNPAGITQLKGQNFQLGAEVYIDYVAKFKATDGSGTTIDSDRETLAVPHFYYSFTPEKGPFSFGLGVYMPFGLSLQWPDNTPFRDIAIEGRLHYLTINPVVAYKILPNLSVAAGPNINYSDVKLRTGVGLSPGDEFRFRGNDTGVGFNAGILWQPSVNWSLGANYRSASTLDYAGHSELYPYSGSVDTTAKLKFPQVVSGGVSWRPTADWNIEVDVDWTDWHSFDSVTFDGALNPFTGQNIVLPLYWKSSWFYEVGATRYFGNGWYASLGYFFSENSTSEQYFNPTVPDTDLHVGSIGGGHRGKHWDWSVAAQIITGGYRTVQNSQSTNPLGLGSADGQYRLIIPAVSVAVGYHF
jgi:long-chain fatty acid transport protein